MENSCLISQRYLCPQMFALVFGGVLTAPTGQIASPLYPSYYLNNLDVTWTIYVSGNMRVNIRFIEFTVEGAFFDCMFDAFEVSSPLVVKVHPADWQ